MFPAITTSDFDQTASKTAETEPHYVRRGVRGRHSVHAVVVTDYDTGKDTVHVVDPSPRQMFRGHAQERHPDYLRSSSW